MAITRRQFVTRLGTMAAAMGMSQADLAKMAEAFAHTPDWDTGAGGGNKPKVVWIHGAECTGCSTSLLSLFEDVTGVAVEGTSITTLKALDLAVGGDGDGSNIIGPTANHRSLNGAGYDVDGAANSSPYIANIADVLIDFIDLQYHETVMSMGGALAYEWLKDTAHNGAVPYVLVIEGAIQPREQGGAWRAWAVDGSDNEIGNHASWCSIGVSEDGTAEHDFAEVVELLATRSNCAAIIPIGQCACFGGYPGCEAPRAWAPVGMDAGSQSGAKGTYDFLIDDVGDTLAASKVINVPGCPTNPWWFILTVVAWLADYTTGAIGILDPSTKLPKASAVDSQQRLKMVYPAPLHGVFCTRDTARKARQFATKPGDPGCLQLIGCKGPHAMTLCGMHGWNGQQPRNNSTFDYSIGAVNGARGGNCVAAGHPCMACTEKGYPDAFVPFVVR